MIANKLFTTLFKQQQQFQKLYSQTPCFSFAKLKKQFDHDLSNFDNVNQYYQDLLRFAQSSERGILTLQPENFERMLTLAKNREDVESLINAYYNFKGHRVTLTQTLQDKFISKAIELESGDLIHDIFQHHTYLMYFPHFNVTKNLIDFHVKQQNQENLQKLLKIIEQNHLLQVQSDTFSSIFNNTVFDKDQNLNLIALFRIFKKRDLKLSENQLSQITIAFSQFYGTEEQQSNKNLQKYQNQIQEYANQYPNNLNTLQIQSLVLLTNKSTASEGLLKLEEITSSSEKFDFQSQIQVEGIQKQVQNLTGGDANKALQVYTKIAEKFTDQQQQIKTFVEELQGQKQEPVQEEKAEEEQQEQKE